MIPWAYVNSIYGQYKTCAKFPRQVAPTATEQELKKAYKVGALKYHPGMLLNSTHPNMHISNMT